MLFVAQQKGACKAALSAPQAVWAASNGETGGWIGDVLLVRVSRAEAVGVRFRSVAVVDPGLPDVQAFREAIRGTQRELDAGNSIVIQCRMGAVEAAVGYLAGRTDRCAFRQAMALLQWDPAKLPRGIDG